MTHPEWRRALAQLEAWHDRQEERAATEALTFFEEELRRRFPAAAWRRWPQEQLEDALQGFLERLLDRRLPATAIDHPRAYLIRSFQHWCIDIERGRRRDPTEPWEDPDTAATTDTSPEVREALSRTLAALDSLPIQDRVVLKMTDAPATLSWEELRWLAGRAGSSAEQVRDRVLACPSIFDLTLIFDPGPPPRDAKERRDRMERFRRRRARARERLRGTMGDTP